MSTHDREPDAAADLRRQAEKIARARASQAPQDLEAPSPEAARQGLHELQVHQIELEMQNEELRRTQEALEASRARYFDLYDLAPVGYVTVSEKGLILEANLTAATLLGVARGDLAKQPLTRFIARDHQDTYYLHRKQLFETATPQVAELQFVRKGSLSFWARVEATLSYDAEGAPVCRAAISDVTERKLAEQALADERQRLAVTVQAMSDAVIATDAHGRVTLINRAAQRLTGWTEMDALGRPLANVLVVRTEELGDSAGPPAHQPFRAGGVAEWRGRGILVAKDGAERLIAGTAAPIPDGCGNAGGTVVVFQDVTLQRRLDADLLQANKLESLGVLAGGIAHDFNNLLTGIIGSITLAAMEAPPGSEQEEVLAEAEKAASRATGLARQLLTFARGGEPVRRRTDLPEVVMDAARFAIAGSRSSLAWEIEPDLWPVEADPGQIAQVIQNMVINADQAMADGGKVTVRAANAMVRETDPLPLKPGEYVRVTVADTGVGIPPHLLKRIFDPYFTTKPTGNGIGLAVAYSVVAKHEGHIAVRSRPGEGSEFSIYLPATTKPAAPPSGPVPEVRAKGRILVMDDEDVVSRVARRMLQRLGYRPVMAADGAEAVALYRQAAESQDPIDVVILDLVIPHGMGGLEALEELKRIDPHVRAIVSSGYAKQQASMDLADHGFLCALPKPYNLDDMAEVLALVLHGDGTGARASCVTKQPSGE